MLANVNYKMMPGTIVQTNYREPLWPEGKVSPYQIELDDGALIYAPYDGDNAVQKYDRSKDESLSTNKSSKKGGKKQLRNAARFAEKELEERNKLKEDLFIPEEGNETTNQEEFMRAGMLEAQYLPVDDVNLRYKMAHAGWHDLKLSPDVADLHSILNALERLFSCLPQVRKENAMLKAHDVEYFMLNSELFPFLLRMCIAPEQFVSEDEDSERHEPSEFVWDMISLLGKLQSQANLVLNGLLARELASITRICTSRVVLDDCDGALFLAYERGGIDPLFDKGDYSAFLCMLEEVKSPFPRRGHFSQLAWRIMVGKELGVEPRCVEQLCSTITATLANPKNCAETNAELFGTVLRMLECPELAGQVLPLTLDALRDCQLNREIDTSVYGGLDNLIKAGSKSIAAFTGNDDELFLVKEIFNTDSRAMATCYCHRHRGPASAVVCVSELKKSTIEIITSSINNAEAYLESQKYDKVLEMTTNAIKAIDVESPRTGGRLLWDNIDKKRIAHALRGRAHLELGAYEEAIYSLCIAIGGNPIEKKNWIYGAESSKIRCDACLNGIRALAALGDIEKAKGWHSFLMEMKVKATDSDEIFTAQYLSHAQAEATVLVSTATTTPTTAQATIIDGGSALEGFSHPVRQASWKSVGELADAEGSINPTTFAVPRLNIALIYVRGQLLIWNYKDSKVIQWIEIKKDCSHWAELFDTEAGTLFVYYPRSRLHTPIPILLDNVHMLEQGATCNVDVASAATIAHLEHSIAFGNQTPDKCLDNLIALGQIGDVSMFAAAQNKKTSGWSLAIVKDSVKAEIVIYTGDDTIAPGCALGPFALLKDKPSFVLGDSNGHLDRIYEVLFVDDGSANTLVTSSSDKSIKVWDLSSRLCQATIRGGFNNLVRTLVTSPTFLFGAEIRDGAEEKDSTHGSHCINVWEIRSGQRKAKLRSKSGGTVNSLVTLPQQNIVLSGHDTGEVHVWRYGKEFEHIHGIKVLSPSASLGMSIHLHKDYIAVMSMTHIVMLQDATETKDDQDGVMRLPAVGQSLNCGNCQVWKFESSSKCSRCRKVYFCNEACLRKAWPKHKKNCHKRK